ncbi:hypothetical protein J2851_004952 [Azospirillum rugosum]|uniref:Uncharacterized protein n=1 Tax=Azospirillum rugosum TaxID=416170 RepID=A0ABS4SRG6_9PROT|nr:hypothetical protein [Azospirillum rugosum]MDQ0528523.1 hypothetical protein [Azospirillum rugosum]
MKHHHRSCFMAFHSVSFHRPPRIGPIAPFSRPLRRAILLTLFSAF